MNSQMVMSESEALELLAFMLSCADICREEPAIYGCTRMLQAANHLARVVTRNSDGKESEFWNKIYNEVELKSSWYRYNFESWNEFVSQMPVWVANELKRREDQEKETK